MPPAQVGAMLAASAGRRNRRPVALPCAVHGRVRLRREMTKAWRERAAVSSGDRPVFRGDCGSARHHRAALMLEAAQNQQSRQRAGIASPCAIIKRWRDGKMSRNMQMLISRHRWRRRAMASSLVFLDQRFRLNVSATKRARARAIANQMTKLLENRY